MYFNPQVVYAIGLHIDINNEVIGIKFGYWNVLDSHVIGRSPGRQGPSSAPPPPPAQGGVQ